MKINNVEVNDYEVFILSRWLYSIGKNLIDNTEYNALRDAIKAGHPDNVYIKRSWSSDPCPVELLKKVNMPEHIRSVILGDKTESIESLDTWEALDSTLRFIGKGGTLSYKLDGWNTQANYYNGEIVNVQSRGRSTDAINMGVLSALIPNKIPVTGKIRITLETTIPKENREECKRLYGSATLRNGVHSILSRGDRLDLLRCTAHGINGMQVDPAEKFTILKDWGFDVPKNVRVDNLAELKFALEDLSNNDKYYSLPTDGVVYWGDLVYAIRLLTWEEPIYNSYVTGYTEKYSEHRINPSIQIFPIDRDGTKQTQVNITNWQRIIDNNLQMLAPIAFRLKAHAIADIDADATRRLQEVWKGRYDVYREKVEINEKKKQEKKYFHTQ